MSALQAVEHAADGALHQVREASVKVRLLVEVGDYERFVISKYWAPVSAGIDRTRTRGTRAQVRRFISAALKSAVKEQASAFRGRTRSAARRLQQPEGHRTTESLLREPDEKQQALTW